MQSTSPHLDAIKRDVPQVLQLIYMDTERRGGGQEVYDPVRGVKQVFLLDGTPLLEYDPYATLSIKQVMQVIKQRESNNDPSPLEELLDIALRDNQRRSGF